MGVTNKSGNVYMFYVPALVSTLTLRHGLNNKNIEI
jgi:hypothetical protein